MEMFKRIVFFDALSDEAKEKARNWYRESNDMPMLQSHLCNVLKEKLEEKGFSVLGYPEYKDLTVLYSLSNSQGDGVCFEGTLERDGITYTVKHSGHYYHEYSMDVSASDKDGEELEPSEKVLASLRAACKETERVGYDEIDYENSAEYIDEAMEANEYTFTLEGVRMDADNNA